MQGIAWLLRDRPPDTGDIFLFFVVIAPHDGKAIFVDGPGKRLAGPEDDEAMGDHGQGSEDYSRQIHYEQYSTYYTYTLSPRKCPQCSPKRRHSK